MTRWVVTLALTFALAACVTTHPPPIGAVDYCLRHPEDELCSP